jgi:hypothetical protein
MIVYYERATGLLVGNQNPVSLTIIVDRSSIRPRQIEMTHIPKPRPETPKYDFVRN